MFFMFPTILSKSKQGILLPCYVGIIVKQGSLLNNQDSRERKEPFLIFAAEVSKRETA